MQHVARTKGAPGAPLFLTFHGTGGDEHQFHRLASDLMPQAHVTSPRGEVSEHGANRYFRRTGEGIYDMADLALRTDAMVAFIEAEKTRTGAASILGLGYSNGANILASVALTNPGQVDTMVLMHPLIPWTPAPQPGLAGRRVLITAGERDPICPKPMTDALVAYLTAQGAAVETLWHPGGHEIRAEELAAVARFLDAH